MSLHRTVAALLVVLWVVTGCTGAPDEGAAPSAPPAEEPSASPRSSTSPSPSPSPTPAVLDARYRQDSDGNAVPDFLERELGYDPLVDDCARDAACPGVTETGDTPLLAEQNVLLILDSSGSMAGDDGAGTVKIDAAKAAIERYVVATPDVVDVGLMVYGHRGGNDEADRAESCAGIDVFAQLGELTVDTVPGVLAQFSPTGWTPVAASLDRAAEVFAGREGQANRVVLVTDGVETCDGDAVAAAQRLKQSGIAATVDVIGFDVEETAQEDALRQVAEITGGTYTTAGVADDLTAALEDLGAEQAAAFEALICVLRSIAEVDQCVLRLEVAAEDRIGREAIAVSRDGDTGQVRLLQDLQQRISARSEARRAEWRAVTEPRLQELAAAVEEARRRYRERFGTELAAVPCPFA